MHTGPVPGDFETDWHPTKEVNPGYKCRECGSNNIWFRMWESGDGAYEDIKYECRECNHTWWIEGSDS